MDLTSPQLPREPSSQPLPNMEPSPLEQLTAVSVAILAQALDLISNSLTDDAQLTYQSKMMPGSTIGKHLRHAKDHFSLLLDCLLGSEPFVLSYDTRSRNTPMESSRQAATAAIQATIDQLHRILDMQIDMQKEMTLNAVTPYPQVFRSSVGRELWFAGLHAVHHWSMIRVIASELNITVEETLGVAPATLVYRDLQKARM